MHYHTIHRAIVIPAALVVGTIATFLLVFSPLPWNESPITAGAVIVMVGMTLGGLAVLIRRTHRKDDVLGAGLLVPPTACVLMVTLFSPSSDQYFPELEFGADIPNSVSTIGWPLPYIEWVYGGFAGKSSNVFPVGFIVDYVLTLFVAGFIIALLVMFFRRFRRSSNVA